MILDPAVGMKSKNALLQYISAVYFKTVEGVKRQTPKYAAKIYNFEWITKHFFLEPKISFSIHTYSEDLFSVELAVGVRSENLKK